MSKQITIKKYSYVKEVSEIPFNVPDEPRFLFMHTTRASIRIIPVKRPIDGDDIWKLNITILQDNTISKHNIYVETIPDILNMENSLIAKSLELLNDHQDRHQLTEEQFNMNLNETLKSINSIH